jgi:PAS domain S-box-containing protein
VVSKGLIVLVAFTITIVTGWYSTKQSDLKLKQSNRVNKAINALLVDKNFGYAILDERARVVEWNPALEKLSGWPKSEMLGKNLYDVMVEGDFERHKAGFEAAVAERRKRREEGKEEGVVPSIIYCKIKSHNPGGPDLEVRVVVRLVVDEEGEVYAIGHIESKEQAERNPEIRANGVVFESPSGEVPRSIFE